MKSIQHQATVNIYSNNQKLQNQNMSHLGQNTSNSINNPHLNINNSAIGLSNSNLNSNNASSGSQQLSQSHAKSNNLLHQSSVSNTTGAPSSGVTGHTLQQSSLYVSQPKRNNNPESRLSISSGSSVATHSHSYSNHNLGGSNKNDQSINHASGQLHNNSVHAINQIGFKSVNQARSNSSNLIASFTSVSLNNSSSAVRNLKMKTALGQGVSNTHKQVHASNYGIDQTYSNNSRSALGSSLGISSNPQQVQQNAPSVNVTNISPKERRKKMDTLLKQVDEILMYQPQSQQTSSTSPQSLFNTKRNTIVSKPQQETTPKLKHLSQPLSVSEKHYFENVDDEQMPMEQEPYAQIEPPLYFETRINDKQAKTIKSMRQKGNNDFLSAVQESKLKGNLPSNKNKNQNPQADGDISNLWYDSLTLGSQTERQKDKNTLLFQKFVNFKETLSRKDIQTSKNGISRLQLKTQKQNQSLQSQLATNATTFQSSKMQKFNINSTAFSCNNTTQMTLKTMKINLNSGNLPNPSKRISDQEENKNFLSTQSKQGDTSKDLQFKYDSELITHMSESPKKQSPIINKKQSTLNDLRNQIKQRDILKIIISYTTMTESINFLNINKGYIRQELQKDITKHQRNLIISTGLTRIERIRLWYNKTSLLQVKQVQKGQLPHLYRRLSKKKSKFNQEIIIDAERTFPHILLFGNQERAVEMLIRILNAVANHMPDLGYVQGMNSIALSLMLILQNEEDTFYMMIQLLQKYKLKDMYLNNFNQLKLLCFQLDSFVKAYLPLLYDIFETQSIDSEYFATKWFLTLFTFDLSIENISTVLDLFMVEGFKSLIKIALAILDYTMKMFQEGQFAIAQHSNMNETFVDILKHFSEELKVDSHHLLCEAQNFKVTSRLMKDMEKLYIKETMPQRRRTERNPNSKRPIVDERMRGCRSNSLKHRMLVIAKDQNNKLEWRILPQLPSKINHQEEVLRPQNIQNFEEFLETYEVSFSQCESSRVLSSGEKNDLISVFSECEEIKGSDEKGINVMLSHKKPYASRMVMSNKKQKQVEDRVISIPMVFNYGNQDEGHQLRKQTQVLKIQQRKQTQNGSSKSKDLIQLQKSQSLKNALGLLSENVGTESRIDLGVPQLSKQVKSKPNKLLSSQSKSKNQSEQKSKSNRKEVASERSEQKQGSIYETVQSSPSPKQINFKKFKERFTNKHQLKLQAQPSLDQSKKKSSKNISLEKTVLKSKQNFTKPVINYNSNHSNYNSSNFASNTESNNATINIRNTIQQVTGTQKTNPSLSNSNINKQIYLNSLSYITNNTNNSLSQNQNSQNTLIQHSKQQLQEHSQKIVKQKSNKQLSNAISQTIKPISSQYAPLAQSNFSSYKQQQQQLSMSDKKQASQVSISQQGSSIQQHIKLAKQVRKVSNKSMSQIKEQNATNINMSNMSAGAGAMLLDTLNGIMKTSNIINHSLEYDQNNVHNQQTLEFDLNNDDYTPITNVKIPRSKIKLSAHHMHHTSQQAFQVDSPKINKINPIKLRQKFDDDTLGDLPFQIKNLDTGEVTSLDPYMKLLEFI